MRNWLLSGLLGSLLTSLSAYGVELGLADAGLSGGVIVQLGCGDPSRIAALDDPRFVVQALAGDQEELERARASVGERGSYGRVSVVRWTGKELPYVDNSVNAVVVEATETVASLPPSAELLRVLVPGGVVAVPTSLGLSLPGATARSVGDVVLFAKPVPGTIDSWTHALYDAAGNAVSRDKLVGPPSHLQWTAGPKWTRHHESASSFQAMVSEEGRIFHIVDEAPQVSLFLPSEWRLVARDAFNGKLLWKRKIRRWVTQLYPYKSGPMQMTRRLLAVGGQVYAPLSMGAPIEVMDAATGRTLRTLEQTNGCEEMLCHGGLLYVMTGGLTDQYQRGHRFARGNAWRGETKTLKAVDPATGRCAWQVETPIAPLSYAVNARGAVFHDGRAMVCLDPKTGQERWRTPVTLDTVIPTSNTPTLVLYRDVVLFIGGADHKHRGGGWYAMRNLRTFTALALETGDVLWSYRVPPTGFECPKDILVVDDLVWIGAILLGASPGGKCIEDELTTANTGIFTGRDLHTGKVVREFSPPWQDLYWFHQRCYRSKATDRFIIPARTGTEFISPKDGWISHNHWVRGACLYGTMPANGLLYQPPHPCGCYMESLLHGFNALAAPSARAAVVTPTVPPRQRGTACARPLAEAEPDPQAWPTFRHDAERSGSTDTPLAEGLEVAWRMHVGSRLTAVTAADRMLLAADKDAHTLHALDAMTGRKLWHFTATGRIDSPPTLFRGRAFFGCRDGYVYCLDLTDGALAWRYRAAPADRRLLADEQLESVWPLHGAVLAVNGRLYAVAGRSMFLDGGLRLLVLDPATGRKVSETVMDSVDPTAGRELQAKINNLSMPVAMPDILSSDGKHLYMKSQKLTLDGRRVTVEALRSSNDQVGDGAHFFTPGDMLDDTGFHRIQVLYGKTYTGGHGPNHTAPKFAPGGKMLVFDGTTAYGFSRMPHLHRWVRALEWHLYAAPKQNPRRGRQERPAPVIHAGNKPSKAMARIRKSLLGTAVKYTWSQHEPPLFGRTMVLAGRTLFVAGPPAIRNETTAEATARWRGSEGGLLWALAADDGRKLAEYKLDAPPVFDGMAAAFGKLYIPLVDGSIICLRSD